MLTLSTLILTIIAVDVSNVPDSGVTGLLLGGSVLAVGMIARFVKNRKS
jgi:hypothetical protein